MDTLSEILPAADIPRLCKKWNVRRLAVFGSILRTDFRPDSDVDFLVDFVKDDAGPWFGNLSGLAEDLTQILGRHADVVPSSNLKWVVRDQIISSSKVLYEV